MTEVTGVPVGRLASARCDAGAASSTGSIDGCHPDDCRCGVDRYGRTSGRGRPRADWGSFLPVLEVSEFRAEVGVCLLPSDLGCCLDHHGCGGPMVIGAVAVVCGRRTRNAIDPSGLWCITGVNKTASEGAGHQGLLRLWLIVGVWGGQVDPPDHRVDQPDPETQTESRTALRPLTPRRTQPRPTEASRPRCRNLAQPPHQTAGPMFPHRLRPLIPWILSSRGRRDERRPLRRRRSATSAWRVPRLGSWASSPQ